MTDKIILNGIEVMGRHGCTEAERENEQLFIVDAELYLDLSRAGKSDDINDTIDYPQVIVDIKKNRRRQIACAD
ncbi:MAG: dihydroneopterin aldolase [Selenomonadaceae bacterium]|nr:dihydroneopterin aldolase [Selenomonadaceae bacterium]